MMHIAIVEDCVFDQKHLIDLIQKNFENHGEMADFTCYESGEAFLEAFRPGLFNAVFMDIMPVSYTHLDVYKRQAVIAAIVTSSIPTITTISTTATSIISKDTHIQVSFLTGLYCILCPSGTMCESW